MRQDEEVDQIFLKHFDNNKLNYFKWQAKSVMTVLNEQHEA
jgi:hypothetical protein